MMFMGFSEAFAAGGTRQDFDFPQHYPTARGPHN